MPEHGYYYNDKSKLYNAWIKYYTNMGLAYNKLNHKVYQRVRKGKFPTR